MHTRDLSPWTHEHVFDEGSHAAERGTRAVMWITAVMMVIEIIAGWWFNSMALLADGWHMSSHAVAIGLSAFAYAAARRYARDPRFAFGTWKIEVLAGFSSAIFLLGVAAMMVFASVERIFSPQPIHYQDAIVVAAVGLIVNVVCAMILGHAHDHDHDHGHHHHHDHEHHHDLNLKSAYLHVLADALTSLLAIFALLGAKYLGFIWADPLMGIVGALLVARWSLGLLHTTSVVLLDRQAPEKIRNSIRTAIERDRDNSVTDLHVWAVGPNIYSAIVSVVTHEPLAPSHYKSLVPSNLGIVHLAVEVHRCTDD